MEEPALRVVRRQRVFAIGALIWAIAFAGTAWRWGRSVTHAAASPTLALDVRAQSLTFSNDRFVISQVDGWRVQVWLVDPASPARATPRVTDLAALTARARRDAQRTPKQQDPKQQDPYVEDPRRHLRFGEGGIVANIVLGSSPVAAADNALADFRSGQEEYSIAALDYIDIVKKQFHAAAQGGLG